MSSQVEFLRAIAAHPNSDLPRLRFANALDDDLDPLGEFIRVQIHLETLIERKRENGALNAKDREVLIALDLRERELLDEYENDWIGPIAEWAQFWTFRRGFVNEIGTTPDLFMKHADAMFQLAPVQVLHVNELGDFLPQLLQCPQIQRLRFLDLSSNDVGDRGAYLLATSPQLQGLTGLNLTDTQIGDRGAKALSMSPYLKNLRELYLTDNPISHVGERRITSSKRLTRLETLHFDSGPLCNALAFPDDLPF